jgi:cell division protein FtsL
VEQILLYAIGVVLLILSGILLFLRIASIQDAKEIAKLKQKMFDIDAERNQLMREIKLKERQMEFQG